MPESKRENFASDLKTDPPPSTRLGLRRWVYVALGCTFVAIGALGVALPVLPTTPFLLLASACFIRSSPRLNAWLLRSRVFGPFLRDWQKHHGVRLHVKITAVTVLVLVAALSLWLGDLHRYAQVGLVALALVGLLVVLRLKTIRGNGETPQERA